MKLPGLKLTNLFKRDVPELVRQQIAGRTVVLDALGFCLMDILHGEDITPEKWEGAQDPALVTLGKEYAAYMLDLHHPDADLSADERQFTIDVEWPRFVYEALLLKQGVPKEKLPLDNIDEAIAALDSRAGAFAQDLIEKIVDFHEVVLAYLGRDKASLSPTLIYAAVEMARDENMVEGHAFADWFPKAVAALPDEDYNDATSGWTPS